MMRSATLKLALPALMLMGLPSLPAAPANAQNASFDCALADAADEQAICSDPYLAGLERTYAQSYARARVKLGRGPALKVAKPALRQRRACGGDITCIASVLSRAIAAYDAMGATTGVSLPERVGECAQTFITVIEGRLLGDGTFESGTAIAFGNGGYQVSYEREEAIVASRLDDPVKICLVKLPVNCPPGDERGRWYRTTNLRTGQSWTLPDAQHECGGA